MIEKIFILSCLTFTLHAVLQEDMIFEKVGDWLEKTFGEYWAKPLGMCPVCSGFWHGAALYWLPIWEHTIKEAILIPFILIGLNYIITKLFTKDEFDVRVNDVVKTEEVKKEGELPYYGNPYPLHTDKRVTPENYAADKAREAVDKELLKLMDEHFKEVTDKKKPNADG